MRLHDILIESLPGTSPITIKKFKSIGIHNYWDLLNYFPSRYENFATTSDIASLQEGEIVTIKGHINSASNLYARRGLTIQKVIISDNTGKIEVAWYNQPFLVKQFKVGDTLHVSGKVKKYGVKISLTPTEYEVIKEGQEAPVHTGRLVPVYPETRGLSTKTIRDKVWKAVQMFTKTDDDPEWLPKDLIKNNKLLGEREALSQIHFPADTHIATQARKRLAFDELFTVQLSAALVRKQWEKETVTHAFKINGEIKKSAEKFIKTLPFELTGAQKKVLDEILEDLSQTTPMNRFVQGDVGSGKTVVAAIGAYLAHLNGFQTLIMAPTEILAQQHYNTITKLFKDYPINVGIQTGAVKSIKKNKKEMLEFMEIKFDVLIGTHAILTEHVKLDKVGLVVIDEQHRFGVRQRAILKKKGVNPHLLTMTATPIPRTVSLTLYGELDLSVIDEMPKGRLPIKTYLTPHLKRMKGYEWIKEQMKKDGVQCYVICPLVEESESETMTSVKAATKEYEDLKKIFKGFNVALLHGKMKPKEKQEIMADFKDKKYDILVSTSVVEVGIDVPNATIMIIEGAERFGLAQLHQLRGRVGRGDKQSYCFLYTSSEDMQSTQRLQFFSNTTSGMILSEYDLKMRGPGALYGTQQSGYGDLKIASFSDFDLISNTKNTVDEFIKKYELSDFPTVKDRIEKYQIEKISRD